MYKDQTECSIASEIDNMAKSFEKHNKMLRLYGVDIFDLNEVEMKVLESLFDDGLFEQGAKWVRICLQK